MSILLTGFEPFGGAAVNPSWEAVRLVPEAVCGHVIHRLQLPVVYGGAAELLLEEIQRVKPTVVICCGVASGRTGVTPELVAINWRMAGIPDNAGVQYAGCAIREGGADAHMTRLPVVKLAAAIREAGIPAFVSLSAGAYVCNDLYYHLLAEEEELGCRGLFVHVPDADRVDADSAARAIVACIEASLKTE